MIPGRGTKIPHAAQPKKEKKKESQPSVPRRGLKDHNGKEVLRAGNPDSVEGGRSTAQERNSEKMTGGPHQEQDVYLPAWRQVKVKGRLRES